MGLTRDEILEASDAELRKVMVPEWGGDGHVFVRVISGTARDAWEQRLAHAHDGKSVVPNLRSSLLVHAMCDKDGVLLFEDADVTALGAKSAKALDRVFDAVQDLNALTEKASDEIAGNLSAGPENDSGSD